MTITTTTPARPVPRWARMAAGAAALTTLPSGLWRLAMGLQVPVGFTESGLREFGIPGWGTAYVIGLSIVAECLALLTLGLVRGWGEVVPEWVPVLGGRRIPPLAATVPAAAGAVAVTLLTWQGALGWSTAGDTMAAGSTVESGPYEMIMTIAYAPLLLWGPLLGAVTLHYWFRRSRG